MTRFSPEACLALVLFAALLVGCDRPMVNPIAPDIEVVSPDLGVLQSEREVLLQLSVASLSGVDEVRVNGNDAMRNDETDLWEIEVDLRPGANTFVLEAFSDDVTAVEEVDIIRANITVNTTNVALPEARAEHTATAIRNGILIAGGVGPGSGVLDTARLLTETDDGFIRFDKAVALQFPRAAHTATLLPDGRVLLMGGTSTPEASGAMSFVADPEIYDPETDTTRPVFTRRARPRRSNHSTVFLSRDNRLYLYSFGGLTPDGASDTFDIFEFKSSATADTLVTLSPGGGASGPARLGAHTQTLLTQTSTQTVTVLTGVENTAGGPLPFAARLFYTTPGSSYPFSVNVGAAELPLAPRTSAAGETLGNSLALLAGGRGAAGAPLASLEVFADRSGRFLSVPQTLRLARYGHTVTRAQSGRILVLGGRDASGQALSSIEVLTL